MTYQETIDYLYSAAPAFTKVGASAYKEGLQTTLALDAHAGHPHDTYLTVHVAGTNGKGSVSHTLAAILQEAGLRVGLYTSPHLVTFRERLRVNGVMASEQWVIDWVERNREFFEPLSPSFFELTTAMAFEYFREQHVDIAVIEVGLGGRLDCTNIITPVLSVITNISFDHTQLLGDTLAKIAAEKAGIIKRGVPVVVGETTAETRAVFGETASRLGAPITFAEDSRITLDCDYELKGTYQARNLRTVLHCLVPLARALKAHGFAVSDATATVRRALTHVCETTGLRGRWQTLSREPLTVCDTGHNVAGWQYLARQIAQTAAVCRAQDTASKLRVVFGMVDDKDLDSVLSLLASVATDGRVGDTVFYFTQASTHRAIPAAAVLEKAHGHRLAGRAYPSVAEAYEAACADAAPCDFLFVGGSSYVVADLLTHLDNQKPQ